MLRRGPKGVRVLLILDPYDRWTLPKGHVEEGERPREAALREVREETGLRELAPGPEVETVDWRFRDGGVEVHEFCVFYLMHSPRGEAVPDEEGEGIRACRWLDLGAAVERVGYANTRHVVRRARGLLDAGDHPFEL